MLQKDYLDLMAMPFRMALSSAAGLCCLLIGHNSAIAQPLYNRTQQEFVDILRANADVSDALDSIQSAVAVLKSSSPSIGVMQLGRMAYNTYLSNGYALAGSAVKALSRQYTRAKACYLVRYEGGALNSGDSNAVASIVAMQLLTGYTYQGCSSY